MVRRMVDRTAIGQGVLERSERTERIRTRDLSKFHCFMHCIYCEHSYADSANRNNAGGDASVNQRINPYPWAQHRDRCQGSGALARFCAMRYVLRTGYISPDQDSARVLDAAKRFCSRPCFDCQKQRKTARRINSNFPNAAVFGGKRFYIRLDQSDLRG